MNKIEIPTAIAIYLIVIGGAVVAVHEHLAEPASAVAYGGLVVLTLFLGYALYKQWIQNNIGGSRKVYYFEWQCKCCGQIYKQDNWSFCPKCINSKNIFVRLLCKRD